MSSLFLPIALFLCSIKVVNAHGGDVLFRDRLVNHRRMMHAFLGRVANQMRESTVWRRETEAQWEETRECLERVVMHKVYHGQSFLCLV